MPNAFDQADAWNPEGGSSDDWIPNGDHVVSVRVADDDTAKSSGNPKLAVELEDDQGRQRKDWIPYSEKFLNRIVSIFDAAGIDRPRDGEFDPQDHMRLTSQCRGRLIGKKVGIIVRDGDPNLDGKIFPEVQGYVLPSRITQVDMPATDRSDVPIDTTGLAGMSTARSAIPDDEVPF